MCLGAPFLSINNMLTLLPLLSILALTAASPAPAPLPEPVHMALSHMPESAHAKRDGAGQVYVDVTYSRATLTPQTRGLDLQHVLWYQHHCRVRALAQTSANSRTPPQNLIVPVYMGYGSGPTDLVLGSFADSSPRGISLLRSRSWFPRTSPVPSSSPRKL